MKTSAKEAALARLRQEFHAQTSRIPWHDLQTHYASGSVVRVDSQLDLIEVAVALQLDDKSRFEAWIASAEVVSISDRQGRDWYAENPDLWTVVAPPWVLVQQRE